MNDISAMAKGGMRNRPRPAPLDLRKAALFTTANHSSCGDTPSPPTIRSRTQSAPCSPSTPFLSPRSRRKSQRRIKSHEIKLPRRYDASIRVIKTTPDSPRQLEIKIVWDRHVHFYRLELRRLLFWTVMLVFLTSFTSAYKISPGSRFMKPLPKLAASLPEAQTAAGPHPLVDTLFDEIQNIAADNIAEATAPDVGVVANVAQELGRFVSAGEISMDSIRNAAGRACISSLMHKMVGAVIASDVASDVVSCVLHIPAVLII